MVLEQHFKNIFFVILYIICLSKFAILSGQMKIVIGG